MILPPPLPPTFMYLQHNYSMDASTSFPFIYFVVIYEIQYFITIVVIVLFIFSKIIQNHIFLFYYYWEIKFNSITLILPLQVSVKCYVLGYFISNTIYPGGIPILRFHTLVNLYVLLVNTLAQLIRYLTLVYPVKPRSCARFGLTMN